MVAFYFVKITKSATKNDDKIAINIVSGIDETVQ